MDGRLEIHCGDCRDILPTLPAGSVQCCVSSPPYWGLRDYGTAEWEGGSIWCEHVENYNLKRDCGSGSLGGKNGTVMTTRGTQPHTTSSSKGYREICAKCGARRIDAQLGLEATPEEYIAKMVGVFRAVWRVLRNDGTLWVNMGDSYATNGYSAHPMSKGVAKGDCKSWGSDERGQGAMCTVGNGLKPKDLCMMPARLAMALQADGWYLRSEIIWHKPNPMPESVTDRPTKAHEMIYLLAKQERYFYDAEAIREPREPDSLRRSELYGDNPSNAKFNPHRCDGGWQGSMGFGGNINGRNKRSVWTIATQPGFSGAVSYGRSRITSKDCPIHGCQLDRESAQPNDEQLSASASRRSPGIGADLNQGELFSVLANTGDRLSEIVNSIPANAHSNESRKKEDQLKQDAIYDDKSASDIECTEPLSHFSAKFDHMPESKTEEGFGVDEKAKNPLAEILDRKTDTSCTCKYQTVSTRSTDHFAQFPEEIPKLCILAGTKPGDMVLDPFAGSGTVGQVALELGRRAVLIELNPAYVELAQERTCVTPGFF